MYSYLVCDFCTNEIFPFTSLTDTQFNIMFVDKEKIALDSHYLNDLFGANGNNHESMHTSSHVHESETSYYTNLGELYLSADDLVSSQHSYFQNATLFFSLNINIRSLGNMLNFSKLEAFIKSMKILPNIIGINET